MTTILIIASAWLALATVVALLLCRAIRDADARELQPALPAPPLPSPRPALDDTQEFEPIREWGAA